MHALELASSLRLTPFVPYPSALRIRLSQLSQARNRIDFHLRLFVPEVARLR